MVNLAIDTLVLKRAELLAEQAKMNTQFNNEIVSIETAIENLAGSKVWEIPIIDTFDDENPNYIKARQEEI